MQSNAGVLTLCPPAKDPLKVKAHMEPLQNTRKIKSSFYLLISRDSRTRRFCGNAPEGKRTVSNICNTLSCSQASSPSMIMAMRVWFCVKPSIVLAIFEINSTSCFRTW